MLSWILIKTRNSPRKNYILKNLNWYWAQVLLSVVTWMISNIAIHLISYLNQKIHVDFLQQSLRQCSQVCCHADDDMVDAQYD